MFHPYLIPTHNPVKLQQNNECLALLDMRRSPPFLLVYNAARSDFEPCPSPGAVNTSHESFIEMPLELESSLTTI